MATATVMSTPGDGSHPANVVIAHRELGQFRVDETKLAAREVELASQRLRGPPLVGRHGLRRATGLPSSRASTVSVLI
jgi:hypothetical protein